MNNCLYPMLIMYSNKNAIACTVLLKTLMILQQQFVQKCYINCLHLTDLTREVLLVPESEIKFFIQILNIFL